MSHIKTLLLFFTILFSLTSLVYSDLQVKKPLPLPPLPAVKPPTPVVKPPTPSTQSKAPPPPSVKPPSPAVKPPTPAVKPPSPTYKAPPSPVKPPTPPIKPPSPPVKPPVIPWIRTLKDCKPLCEKRCSSHSRPNVCMRACSTCCFRCKCVPPGTNGNREICGKCYTTMTTRGNRPKCP